MHLGSKTAPVLVVMPNETSEGLLAWYYERMRECGIKNTEIQIIQILEETPANSGGRPSVDQIKKATIRVEKELSQCEYKIVVPMGSDALYLMTGLKVNVADSQGYLIQPTLRGAFIKATWEKIGEYKTSSKKTGRVKGDPKYGWVKTETKGLLPPDYKGWVIPTYTLQNIQLTEFALGPALKSSMKRVRRALDNQLKIIDEGFEFYDSFDFRRGFDPVLKKYDPRGGMDYKEWQELIGYRSDVLAIDIETTGDAHRTIDRVAISDGRRTHSLPWTEENKLWLNRQICDWDGWLLFHNRSFDVPRLEANGVKIPEGKVFCTMYGAVVIQPSLPKGLGRVVPIYCDTYPWKWEEIAQADPDLYNALDGFKTARAFVDGIRPLTKQLKMWPLVTGEDFKWGPGVMKTIPVLTDMTEQGLRINKPYAAEWEKQLSAELLTLHQKWAEMFIDVDPASPKQVLDLFYHQWKLPVVRANNKKRNITSDELAVVKSRAYIQSEYARKKDENPWKTDPRCVPETFDLLLEIRKNEKLLGTYCQPALMNEELYVHPSYLPAPSDHNRKDEDNEQSKGATSQGRLASSNPNIQNQGKEARDLYLPDYDDWCFVQFDYTRAEMFAMAAVANDEVMFDDLKEDPYQRIANQVGITRKIAKNVTLAGQYLAGPPKVSDMIMKDEHIYVDPATCGMVLDALKTRWVKRTAFQQYLIQQVKIKGYLFNPFGRIRIFHKRKATEAVNFLPQSIVADVLWCVMLDVWNKAREIGGRMTTTVHDSILIQVPQEKVNEAITEIKPIMERRFSCVAPNFYLPVGVAVAEPGKAWGQVKEI